MGLFDRFKKKEPPPKEELQEEEETRIYSGMRVEVTTLENRLLFDGKLMSPWNGQAELYQFSQDLNSGDLPSADAPSGEAPSEKPEPVRVLIRGYNDRTRKAVYMEGSISPLPKHIWHVEDLVICKENNDRAFFRLDTNVDAAFTPFGGFGSREEHPCRLVNISIGGACISTPHVFHDGDKLLLKVKLLEDRDTSIVFCQVLRIIEKDGGSFEYGCRFLELNETDQEKISQNIFAAQLKNRGTN